MGHASVIQGPQEKPVVNVPTVIFCHTRQGILNKLESKSNIILSNSWIDNSEVNQFSAYILEEKLNNIHASGNNVTIQKCGQNSKGCLSLFNYFIDMSIEEWILKTDSYKFKPEQ